MKNLSENIPDLSAKSSYTKKIDTGFKILFGLTSLITILTTIGIIVILGKETISFFAEVSITEFLFGTRWEPLLDPKHFGVLPLVSGTFMIVFGSSLIAIPAGLLTAIYISEYASVGSKKLLKPVLEILSGIPTVVYGYFALTVITPALKHIFPEIEVFNALSGSIVVGIMVLPMICSLSDDAFSDLPRSLKEGGYALGATSFEVITKITIPAALPRIIASFILSISRAIGETMAVVLAAGATPTMNISPLASIQTMTSYIVQVSMGDTPAGGIEYKTCFAVGSLLFLITLGMNILGRIIQDKFKMELPE